MNIADRHFKEDIMMILEHGELDKDPRPVWQDGTPAHTLFVTHHTRTYDISKGEFPITTIKPTATKAAIKEARAYWIYQNCSEETFKEVGVNWWGSWMNDQRNIGRAYAYNLESHKPMESKKNVVMVKQRLVDPAYGELIENEFILEKSLDGIIYENNYGKYIIIDEYTKVDKNTGKKKVYYTIQYVTTGYKTDVRKDILKTNCGAIDKFVRTVEGIGYLGEYDKVINLTDEEKKILKVRWDSMIRRCYSGQRKTYNDKFVHQDWHSFEQFLKDMFEIPQFYLARENKFKGWELDKDYYGSNCYSKSTCVWLSAQENKRYVFNTNKYIEIIAPNGMKYYELNVSTAAKVTGHNIDTVRRNLNKRPVKKTGFTFNEVELETGYFARYELSRNQVVELLKGIKENPYGRRHMINYYNWANQPYKVLVECTFNYLFSVRGEYIDLMLIQRSSDLIAAGNIDAIQSTALLMMVAKHCGYKPGKFTWVVNNFHIYDRHEEIALEFLKRESSEKQPRLILDTDKINFFEITEDDFKVVDYEPQPRIAIPLAV